MIDEKDVKFGDVFVSKHAIEMGSAAKFMFVGFAEGKTAIDGGRPWKGLPLHLMGPDHHVGIPLLRSFRSDRWVRL